MHFLPDPSVQVATGAVQTRCPELQVRPPGPVAMAPVVALTAAVVRTASRVPDGATAPARAPSAAAWVTVCRKLSMYAYAIVPKTSGSTRKHRHSAVSTAAAPRSFRLLEPHVD